MTCRSSSVTGVIVTPVASTTTTSPETTRTGTVAVAIGKPPSPRAVMTTEVVRASTGSMVMVAAKSRISCCT